MSADATETNLARLIEYFGKAKPLTDIDHNEAKKFSAWRRGGDPRLATAMQSWLGLSPFAKERKLTSLIMTSQALSARFSSSTRAPRAILAIRDQTSHSRRGR
jgi:hypothetical protein